MWEKSQPAHATGYLQLHGSDYTQTDSRDLSSFPTLPRSPLAQITFPDQFIFKLSIYEFPTHHHKKWQLQFERYKYYRHKGTCDRVSLQLADCSQ
jgi:hypothetical protein